MVNLINEKLFLFLFVFDRKRRKFIDNDDDNGNSHSDNDDGNKNATAFAVWLINVIRWKSSVSTSKSNGSDNFLCVRHYFLPQ